MLVTIGPAEAEQQLRTGLAMGADRAIRVDAPGELEPLTVARALHALALREQAGPRRCSASKPSTTITARRARCWRRSGTGRRRRSRRELAVAGGVATVTREIDAGLETLEVDLPAVVTTDLRLNQPRYVKLPEILKAKSKPLAVVPLAELGVAPERQFTVHDFPAPPARGAGVRVKDVAELVAALDARGVLS